MSFWRLRNGTQVTCYLTDGGVKAIPRKLTRHLDGKEASVIQEWLDTFVRLNTVQRERPDLVGVSGAMANLLTRYFEFMEAIGKSHTTIRAHKRCLVLACQFFENAPLANWPTTSKQFVTYVDTQKKVKKLESYRHGQVLQMFWEWCQDEDLVTGPLPKKGRRFVKSQAATPLSRIVTPDEVLSWQLPNDMKLLSLLCYFFSLRPQEALVPLSFLAGGKAVGLECCRVMADAGLYGRLAVDVQAQKGAMGNLTAPKANSKGWVACFDERAARAISSLQGGEVKILYQKKPNSYYRRWKSMGLDVTLKDLRRSSCYWLGHNTTLSGFSIKNHMRHSTITTTELYLRRPSSGLHLDD